MPNIIVKAPVNNTPEITREVRDYRKAKKDEAITFINKLHGDNIK